MTVEQATYPSGMKCIESATETSHDEALSRDQVHHILQNQRRRNVLRFLRGVEGSIRMGDVAEHVAAREYDTTVEQLRSKERQRVYIALYQSHLPKLDRVGLIDYNQDRGIVTPRPELEQLYPYLDVAETAADTESAETTWDVYHFGVSFVSVLLLAGAALNVPPATLLSNYLIGVFIFAMFASIPLLHSLLGPIRNRD